LSRLHTIFASSSSDCTLSIGVDDSCVKFVVDVDSAGIRLDKYLTQQFLAIKPEITRSKIQNFCEQNLIVDEADRPVKNSSQKTKIGQEFIVNSVSCFIQAIHILHLIDTKAIEHTFKI
jgi:hypothetical protein